MSDIFREVDEEVRKDKAVELWKKYGSYVVIACVAVVLGTGGRVAWREYQESNRLAESQRFVAAIQTAESDATAALHDFESLAGDASTGYAVLAGFQEARLRADSGDKTGAVAVYQRIADDGSAGDELRDLARLYAVMLEIDTAPVEALEQRLAPLLADGGPWRASARELTAVLRLREGDRQAALSIFEELSQDPGVPQGIRARAQEMQAALGAQG